MRVYGVINKTTRESTSTTDLGKAAEAANMKYRTYQDRLQRTRGYWEDSEYIITSSILIK